MLSDFRLPTPSSPTAIDCTQVTKRKNCILKIRFEPNATALRVFNLRPFVINELLYRAFDVFSPRLNWASTSVGDSVLGYDLAETNINNGNFKKLKQDAIPELLLVKKSYDQSQRKQSRNWKLKHFTKEGALDTNIEADYNEFLKEDPEMRQNVNIFKDAARQQSMPVDVNDMVDPSVPRITLQELLDYLVLDDGEMCDA
ncbi:hypothetical protein pipiens_010887 [Culex pipiens pipiens]|uniref:60S ribosomal export protein NMD3 OB-fold domain-containing protein n=1 Tax=Culex pipiens pipiens TaxID=38569 RepID=A0ABD1D8E6_CULPP